MPRFEDLTGQRFGRLVALEPTDKKTNDGRRIWKCQCDCGNIKYADCHALKRKYCTSCGCKNKEQVTALGHSRGFNLVGQRFGKLVVLERAKEKLPYSDSIAWICQCDCGNTTITTTSRLNSGNTRSCGCSHKSECEKLIEEILLKEKINFIKEKGVKDLLSEKGIPLRFDFFLPDYNCFIEFDGEQHYQPIHNRYTSKDSLARDRIKNKYCLDNNIKLFRIPYSEKPNLVKNQWGIKDLLNEKFLVKEVDHYHLLS